MYVDNHFFKKHFSILNVQKIYKKICVIMTYSILSKCMLTNVDTKLEL